MTTSPQPLLNLVTALPNLLHTTIFDIIQPTVDFLLGRILNPLLICIFTLIFIVSWGLFLGIIIIGFIALGWRLKSEFPGWARDRLAGVSAGAGAGDAHETKSSRLTADGSAGVQTKCKQADEDWDAEARGRRRKSEARLEIARRNSFVSHELE